MYSTILAKDITVGCVITFSSRPYYVLRVLDLGNKDSVNFIAKPLENQYARPFILEANQPLFSKGQVKFKHSHYWS